MMAHKERGIPFTAWSIPKIMDGTKTQTRRTWGLEFVNQDPDAVEFVEMKGNLAIFKGPYKYVSSPIPKRLLPKLMVGRGSDVLFYIKCPYGQVGDRLWVKEAHFIGGIKPNEWAWYKAGFDGDINAVVWRSPRFMFRWASRKDLEITDLRAERVQDISPHKLSTTNLEREGLVWKNRFGKDFTTELERYVLLEEFEELWNSLNAKRGYGWETNPWVWVIGFKRI